jgi:hypothetical protein
VLARALIRLDAEQPRDVVQQEQQIAVEIVQDIIPEARSL